MKNSMNRLLFIMMSVLLTVGISSCGDDDETPPPAPAPEMTEYDLGEFGSSGVSGKATFIKTNSTTTTIKVELTGTSANGDHPSHIHMNSAAEGGGIFISLTNIDGNTGNSETTVTATDAGAAISYEDLIAYNGYINVHLSPTNLGTIVAQGDIGANDLTGTTKVYTLNELNSSGVLGSLTFAERKNGNALATFDLQGTVDDTLHVSHIHANDIATTGNIIFSFNPIDGTTGMSKTNVEKLDDDTPFGYADVLEVNGYVNVHYSANNLGTIVAQTNIGSNE